MSSNYLHAAIPAALLFVGSMESTQADSLAVIDGATASGACAASYPGTSGPDQLSSCQWDMQVIHAGAAHAKPATSWGT